MHSNLIMGLDIGSTKISTVICELIREDEIKVRGCGTSISAGIEKGKVVNVTECAKAIERAISKAQRESGLKPIKVVATILQQDMIFVKNTGVLMCQDVSGRITLNDKKECIRRSRNTVKNPNQQVVHAIPIQFRVDGVPTKNPVGSFGRNLEVDTLLILSTEESIYKLTAMLKKMNLHISGLAYDGLANGHICLTEEQRQRGALLVDIGGEFTRINLFLEGNLVQAAILPIGGDTFTRDLAQCLRLSIPEAERVKIIHGNVQLHEIDSEQNIEVTTQDNGRKTVKKLLVGQILEARASELLLMMKKKMPLDDRMQTIVFTGGGSHIAGLQPFAEKALNRFTVFSAPKDIGSILEDPKFQTALGLLLYGIKTKAIEYFHTNEKSLTTKIVRWVKEIF